MQLKYNVNLDIIKHHIFICKEVILNRELVLVLDFGSDTISLLEGG